MSEPTGKTVSKVLQVLKQKVSGKLLAGCGEEHFWMRRFYDFNVWSTEKVKEKLDYMHANPAVRGLVLHPGDWGWSSWGFHERGELGKIRIDPL